MFAFNSFDNLQNVESNISKENPGSITTVDTAVRKVWKTVALIVQILAIAAIVIAGVRYMFASADGKFEIKKQTMGLIVGGILVFAASGIVQFVINITNEVTGATTRKVNTDGTITRYSNYDGDAYNDWDDVDGNGVLDIFEQDSDGDGVNDFKDHWIKEYPEDEGEF